MHTNQYIAELRTQQFVARCRAGFQNEFEWMAWRRKHAKEIEELPLDLRNQVAMAWDNSGPKEFSK